MDTHGGNPYKSLELKQVSIVQINVDSTREWFLVHIFLYPIMFLLHLCPGLHTITNFTVLCRFATKNRGRNDFSHFTIFRYFFVFSNLPEGASEFNKFCGEIAKIGAATTNFTLLFFVTFWFVSLTRRGFRIQQILRKWQKIGAATIFRSFFVFLTYQMALPNSTNSVQILKSRGRNDFSHFVVLTYQRELPN